MKPPRAIARILAPLISVLLTLSFGLAALGLTGCALPQVRAEDRLFLNLSLELLDEYLVPKQVFEGTPVGGLSALTYDRERDRFYVLSDDRGTGAPSRFYTMQMTLSANQSEQSGIEAAQIETIQIEKVTTLLTEENVPFPAGVLDPEGIALSPRGTVFVSSEGVAREGIPPSIDEFDLETGRRVAQLRIPQRYLPEPPPEVTEAAEAAEIEPEETVGDTTNISEAAQGVQDNRGLEALALSAAGMGTGHLEPFRVFSAVEEPLNQDMGSDPDQPMPSRMLHYLIATDQTTLLAEHVYLIEPRPFAATNNGLVELTVIDQAGHFLSLERSFGLLGAGARIFQVAIANATDTAQLNPLPANLGNIQPVYKQLVLDLSELNIPLDNLEGMALGPRLADGSQSLVLISDDNFSDTQMTQWLLFKLEGL